MTRLSADDVGGKVNCVVTKDLSRFGREHVTMDYYLEFVFPEMNVRYIAVNDNEDTDNGLSDFVPFKNLFNDNSSQSMITFSAINQKSNHKPPISCGRNASSFGNGRLFML